MIFVLGSVALLVIAFGHTGARVGEWWGEPMFWLGLAGIYGSAAARLYSPAPGRNERIAIIAFVGLALFIAKQLGNPLAFERYDELLHLRTLDDIIRTQALFVENPLLPISPYYPGLEVVTTAVVQLTGMSYVAAGSIVLAAGRLLVVLGLFLLFEIATKSARVAAFGALVYMAHPNFLYFNAAFAYESLAIPLGAVLIFMVARQSTAPLPQVPYAALVALLSAGVVVTHHVTSLAMIAFLGLWTAVSLLPIFRDRPRRPIVTATGIFAGVLLLWSLEVAALLSDYLSPVLDNAVSGLLAIVQGAEEPRELFVSSSGAAQPLWSRLLGLGAPVILTIAIPFGIWAMWRWHRQTPGRIASVPAVTFALVALAYPVSLAFRLTSRGAAQASGRSAEFLFVGLAIVVAMAVVGLWQVNRHSARRALLVGALAVMVFMGGVIVGTPEWSRVPRPYTPGADARSIEEHGLAVADWADEILAAEARVAADRMTRTLLGAYAGQRVVSQSADGIAVWPLFFSTEIEGRPLEIIRTADVEYIVVDRRLAGADPHTSYVESGEQFRVQEGPMLVEAVEKWESADAVGRTYDNGEIRVYDLRGLQREP